jgi:hypothetical protein
MKAPGDIGWKKYRKLMHDPARRAYYAQNRTPRHSTFIRSLGAKG